MRRKSNFIRGALAALIFAGLLMTGCGGPATITEPPRTTVPAEPAASWETNFLMMDELEIEGDSTADRIDNAGKRPVLGSKITRDQIRSVTFLDILNDVPTSAWDVSAVGNNSVMAWTTFQDGLYDLYIAAEGGINAGTTCPYLFAGYKNMECIDFGNGFHTAEASSMEGMFMGCESLKTLDLSCFDTSKVSNVKFLFYGCKALEDLDIHTFDTSAVTSMYAMFSTCGSIKSLDLCQFKTENVKNMAYMFQGCQNMTEQIGRAHV